MKQIANNKIEHHSLIYGNECWALHRADQQRMHTTELKMLRWIQSKTRKDRIRNEMFRSDAMVEPITTCHPETPFVVWPCDEKRRHEGCKASDNNEGGREETSRKDQTEVDGPSAERHGREETSRKAQTEVDGPSAERHGREETSRKAQTEVVGPSAERSQTTPARPKADTEPRRMAKGNHGDRPRTGIRSAKVRKGTQNRTSLVTGHFNGKQNLFCVAADFMRRPRLTK